MPRGLNGILNVDKPAGMTSHDVVAAIRRMSDSPRVGHAGTLDPIATGVLLICTGQATRVSEYLVDHDKKYRARIRLGIETDTLDSTGTVVSEREVTVGLEEIEEALASLTGKTMQTPPAYSAIKHKGVPLYQLARQGVEVETAPRQVEIYHIALTELALPEIEIDVECSKGTYIRSLARDLGAKLGCGAHMTALTRTASGQFTIDDAVSLDQLREAFAAGFAARYLHPLDEALVQFEAIVLDADTTKRVRQGQSIRCGQCFASALLRAYSAQGELIALLERGDAPDEWKPKKVFTD